MNTTANRLRPLLKLAELVPSTKVVNFEANIYPRTRYGSDDVEKVHVMATVAEGAVISLRVFGWEDYTHALTEEQLHELASEARFQAEWIQ